MDADFAVILSVSCLAAVRQPQRPAPMVLVGATPSQPLLPQLGTVLLLLAANCRCGRFVRGVPAAELPPWPQRTSSSGTTLPSGPAARLQADLSAAIARRDAEFHIPAGDYHFGSTPLNVSVPRRLTIVAHGNPRLLFHVGGYVVITGAVDSMLLGPITIDYTEEPASQVRLSPLYTRKPLRHSRFPAPAPAPGSCPR
eukprot:COSAG01_NODE_13773_length_1537_cov_2.423505_2_plen_198_part_00